MNEQVGDQWWTLKRIRTLIHRLFHAGCSPPKGRTRAPRGARSVVRARVRVWCWYAPELNPAESEW
jgi:hypothetical protein